MKFHFEPDLDFQLQAIESVCDLFLGQEVCRTDFTVVNTREETQKRLSISADGLGIGNELNLLDDEIFVNLKAVQLHNGLPASDTLDSGDFTVEMETGTGKTYVYLRTIFELNKRYGFTKFVIVVPSVAIKEGVYKTLHITQDHFRGIYPGTPFEYFLYDSMKLGQVRNFVASSHIQIMIVTVGAINKQAVNNLYKDSEKTGGAKPIDLIQAVRPILIVDEPQSVDGGLQGRGKKALEQIHPLFTLRYSATHVHPHHMVYRLDAVDAYERKLVKQIEIASATVEDSYNKPYVRIVSTRNQGGRISAKIEIDVEKSGQVRRQSKYVYDGEDLEQVTGRALYRDFRIGEISVQESNRFVEIRVPGDNLFLQPGQVWGDVDLLSVQREMIRRTIREHFDKEKRLHPQGIKVLSLFFVDTVDGYRKYDESGRPVKGTYASIFEEEYQRLIKHPDYRDQFTGLDPEAAAGKAHEGYFSIDRRKVAGETIEVFKNTLGKSKDDESTYNLIMRDKEKLLSMETPLKFIFSHSALREGWDNPNVFQICALRDIKTQMERRQTIGRGLRLCVNQEGRRLRGFDINTLTVIAMESYQQFAENLQREIESETGIRFGVIERHHFASIEVAVNDGETATLGVEASGYLWDHLKHNSYIDAQGKIQDSLRKAIEEDAFIVPEQFMDQLDQIVVVLRKQAGRFAIRNADERRRVRPRQAVLQSQEFKALWDRIKHKTTYRVLFNNEHLIKQCTQALRDAPIVLKTRLQWRRAGIAIGAAGVEATETGGAATVVLDEKDVELPDLLTELQDRTQLTRRSIQRILCKSGRLSDFMRNPQQFIQLAAQTINRCKRQALVDGIKYHRLGDEHYYAQELFEQEELTGYLKNMRAATKSVYEQVIYESDVEARFADELEKNMDVKVYAKLPDWFTVSTPLGSYNPDWAVLIYSDAGERLYFVVETKASLFVNDLRGTETAKIKCGKAHFKALNADKLPARYEVATSVQELLAGVDAD